MSEEMLDPSVFTRGPWQVRIFIKDWLTDETDLAPKKINFLGRRIARVLRNEPRFRDEDVVLRLEAVDELDEFNDILDDMYDECDRARILVQ